MNENETFLLADVAYWRGEAQRLSKALAAAADAAHADCAPPEPPLGTIYIDMSHGALSWRRIPEGWHCGRQECPNCPCGWAEAWELGTSGSQMRRVLPGESDIR